MKERRKIFLSNNPEPDCQGYNDQQLMLSKRTIEENINAVQKKLPVNNSTLALNNVTTETLQTAAEIFIYLTYCPKITLIQFYKQLLEHDSPKEIILALTSIIKKSTDAPIKDTSIKIFSKAMRIFKLNSYINIETITTNGYSGKCISEHTNISCTEDFNLISIH